MTKILPTQIDTPGIYYHEGLGLISLSSDGINWITIADKNLGATEVWNLGDTPNENNCGKYYQWGNNYGFSWSENLIISDTQVDATSYGPGNYYNVNNFIYGNRAWDISNNENLWGGVTGTVEAMQGPCPNDYHIPSNTERQTIYDIWTTLGGGSSDGYNFRIALKLPFAGARDYTSSNVASQTIVGYYWSATAGNAEIAAYYLLLYLNQILPQTWNFRSSGFSIRPFKNTPVQPDTSRTVLS